MSKKKKKIKEEKKRQDEQKKKIKKNFVSNVSDKGDQVFKQYAKKFYETMREINGFVSGVDLLEELNDRKVDLNNDPHFLWRLWREVEVLYPHSIEFIPQSSIHWWSKPSDWRWIRRPQREKER